MTMTWLKLFAPRTAAKLSPRATPPQAASWRMTGWSVAAVVVAFLAQASAAQAVNIKSVKSPAGITFWMVQDASVPLVALQFSFEGGSAQDPDGKPGTANMAASLLDEGAGDLSSEAFHERLADKSIEMQFQVSHNYLRGTIRTLKENQDEAFHLLQLSLNAPRFDAPDVARIRGQLMSLLNRESTSPNYIARRTWWAAAYAGHPYANPTYGTLKSAPTITVDDLRAYVKAIFARDHLKIGIVGDIDPETAGKYVDEVFAKLPVEADLRSIPEAAPKGMGRRIVVPLDVPQAVVNFGGNGIPRHDPDFYAGYILNDILGGSSFSARLNREVRVKRGLAYGIYSSLVWLKGTALLFGTTATRADRTKETLDVTADVMKTLAADGPTQAELDESKSYLKGSYALGLDTSTKIAAQLVQIQLDNLGIDYIEKRGALIDAVTLDDTKRVAKRLLNGGMLTVVVGKPQGVASSQ